MSSLFYQVRARRQKKDNIQKLGSLGSFFLFHGGYSKNRPLPGHDFRVSMSYQNGTRNRIEFLPNLGVNIGGKVEVKMILETISHSIQMRVPTQAAKWGQSTVGFAWGELAWSGPTFEKRLYME